MVSVLSAAARTVALERGKQPQRQGVAMSSDRNAPTRKTTAHRRSRFSAPRGLIAGTLAALGLTWGLYAIQPGASLLSAQVQTGIFLGLFLLTSCSRRAKVLVVRTYQRYALNPLFKLLFAAGINPLGLAILETRGRISGKIRRVPVGNGRQGDSFWIIAEHGTRAGYVRNIQHDPRVRVRLRIGLRYRWVDGIATVCPDDDPLARQRQIIAWHPLRALNAMYVRVFGADLLTVHVQLRLSTADADGSRRSGQGGELATTDIPPEPDPQIYRPNCAPAYYQGRPATLLINAMKPSRI
jgi:deazaflavin-dependent oxidoreductase (nitroreductase family)